MYPAPVPYQQYFNAYPVIHYQQPPSACNGYGWHGNGYGWQVDPKIWQAKPLYPSLNDVAEEPLIQAEKLTKQNAYFGERGSGYKSKSGAQDFYELRDHHYENGTLFEDPEFPADYSSLFYSGNAPRRNFQWLRPGEIVSDPEFFVEGYSRFDVQQGELGDCWLLAAAANLTLYKRLFFQIVPDDQGFDEKYAGIFHFRFWQYGKWVDVVIDDRLPTVGGRLVFLHSTEENEFWSALLEKAYAKLHGSYESLKGGSTCEAMEDFTGGVSEMYEMNATPPNLFKIILKAYERSSLMGCSIEPDPNVLEAETPQGLIKGHAYSVTKVKYVDIQTPNVSGKIPLLRLRNPWGNEAEWNGAWSDGAPEWQYISEEDKEELGLNFDNDGEFWMSFKDFLSHFSRLEICNLSPDSLSEEELAEGNKKKWEMSVFEGEWVRGVTAGGCRNFLDTFASNPQYRVTLNDVDEGDDEGNCTLIIALMQKNRRQARMGSDNLLTIGFAIYHLPRPDSAPKPLDYNFFKYNASVARSPSFINLREVSCRFKLPPGTYCIIPSTFDPNEEGEFLIRVFSENKNLMEYDGYNSNYFRSNNRVDDEEGNDEEEERQYPGAPSLPSSPYPSGPSYPSQPPYSSNPPFPSTPPYPGYQPNPPFPGYQPNPYPYQPPSYPNPYQQDPYTNPYQPQYPSQPPQDHYPPQPPPRGQRSSGADAVINFLNKLFNVFDEEVGYGEVDNSIKIDVENSKISDNDKLKSGGDELDNTTTVKPSTKTDETDKSKEMFRTIAGEEGEVDWLLLKEILDRTMRTELQQNIKVNGNNLKEVSCSVQQTDSSNFLTSLFRLLCGTLCKDTAVADLIPEPVHEHALSVTPTANGFSKDICRAMVSMLDADGSGKLGYQEFMELLEDLLRWKAAWKIYDTDFSDTLSGFELRAVLSSAGYRLNNKILNILMHRYGNNRGEIEFEDFLMCAIKLKTVIDTFNEKDKKKEDAATFNMQEWLEVSLSN